MHWFRLLTALVVSFAFVPAVDAAINPGMEYIVLSPAQRTESGKNVEVTEFFWYRCPHCFRLEPDLNAWLKKKPRDVSFRRVPAILSEPWAPLARAYYALESLDLVDKLHDKLFDAIHVEGKDLNSEGALFAWVESQGVNRAKFVDAYRSFSVASKVNRARQMTRDYGLDGVPAIVVDGKWRTDVGKSGGTHQSLFTVVDELVARARKERGGK
jgi:thiol:disulfide interchange protein DsbA